MNVSKITETRWHVENTITGRKWAAIREGAHWIVVTSFGRMVSPASPMGLSVIEAVEKFVSES